MGDYNDWTWLLDTDKGKFFVTVCGVWSQAQAKVKVDQVFKAISIRINSMTERKLIRGSMDNCCTIYEDPDSILGYNFMAGREIWVACGRGGDYDRELKTQLEEIHE